MKIWIGEYSYYDEYNRVGAFKTQFGAFIACLKDWKKTMDWYRKAYSHRTYMIYTGIKKLRHYTIEQIEVIE